MTQSRNPGTSMSLSRSVRGVAVIVLAEAILATAIVLATSERSIGDFQRVFLTVGGVCASIGVLGMGSSRWTTSNEIAAERIAMSFRRPRPPGDLALRRSMFLFVISSALLALIGYALPFVFSL